MTDTTTLRAYAALKNSEIHKDLQRQLDELANNQRGLRDVIEIRWNQGRQQQLADLIKKIEGARDEVERIERANDKKRTQRANAF